VFHTQTKQHLWISPYVKYVIYSGGIWPDWSCVMVIFKAGPLRGPMPVTSNRIITEYQWWGIFCPSLVIDCNVIGSSYITYTFQDCCILLLLYSSTAVHTPPPRLELDTLCLCPMATLLYYSTCIDATMELLAQPNPCCCSLTGISTTTIVHFVSHHDLSQLVECGT